MIIKFYLINVVKYMIFKNKNILIKRKIIYFINIFIKINLNLKFMVKKIFLILNLLNLDIYLILIK